MSRKCAISNKGPMSGQNVSHANNKTKRRFLPNIQNVSFYSNAVGKKFKLRLSTNAIRTIDFKGGLDNWISNEKSNKLPRNLRKIKQLIESKNNNS